jgi:hypothetical protein
MVRHKRAFRGEVLATRKVQLAAIRRAVQPPLFELCETTAPPAERTAAGRYLEPSLFSFDKQLPQRLSVPSEG